MMTRMALATSQRTYIVSPGGRHAVRGLQVFSRRMDSLSICAKKDIPEARLLSHGFNETTPSSDRLRDCDWSRDRISASGQSGLRAYARDRGRVPFARRMAG